MNCKSKINRKPRMAKTSGLVLPDARTFSPPVDGASFRRVFPLLWFGFFFGAFAGVMSIGHAADIVANHGGGAALAVIGAVVINIGNAGEQDGKKDRADLLRLVLYTGYKFTDNIVAEDCACYIRRSLELPRE